MKKASGFAAYAIAVLALSALVVGCTGEKKDYLSTPESTINTYLDQARTLDKMADPLAYSRAIDCFAHEAVVWWTKNANNLLEDKSIVDGASGSKREAIAFSKVILPLGPSYFSGDPKIVRISMSGHTAVYKINGVRVSMIQEDGNWRFKSLFGLNEEKP